MTAEHLARMMQVDQALGHDWDCEAWTREDQIEAMAEGWALACFNVDYYVVNVDIDFPWALKSDAEAAAFVKRRADEGSALHLKALTLEVTSRLVGGIASA